MSAMDPSGDQAVEEVTSIQARKVSQAARNTVSQALALCNSAVAASNGNERRAIVQTESGHNGTDPEDETPPEGACATALGNENILTTAGPHAQIFNIVNTYNQQNSELKPKQSQSPTGIALQMLAENVEARVPSYPHVNFNEKVIWCVEENLTKQQLTKIKILLRKEADTGFGVPKEQVRCIETTMDFIDCLENNKLLSVNNTWFLQFLAFRARNRRIYKEVLEFMAERMKQDHPVCVFEPQVLRGSGYSNVQLKVAGDVQCFTNMDVETFRQILSENCGNMVKYTSLTGIGKGCVRLVFQIPSICKNHLLAEARSRAEWLVENGIFQFSIEGAKVNLPKREHQESTPAQRRAQLMSSILTGSPEDVSHLIKNKRLEFVNTALGGKPLLHWACELDKIDWVEYLIEHGANVNARDEMYLTALHRLAFLGLTKVCMVLLLSEGIERFAKTEDGVTPLQIAREECLDGIVKLFQGLTTETYDQSAPHQTCQQLSATVFPSRHSQQANHMDPESWLGKMERPLASSEEDKELGANVEVAFSNVNEEMDVDETSGYRESLMSLETPGFLQELGNPAFAAAATQEKCAECSHCEKPAEMYCIDCKKSLCQACLKNHNAFTKDHTLITSEEFKSGQVTDKGRFCEVHGEQVKYFCETEQKGVCADCLGLMTCAHDHRRITLKEAVKQQKLALNDAVKRCADTKAIFQDAVDKTKKVEGDLTKSTKQTITDLEQLENEYINRVQHAFKSHKDKVNKVDRNRNNEITAKMKTLELGINQIQAWCTNVSEICDSKSEYLIAHEYSTLSTTLEVLAQSQPEPCETELGYLRFEPVETQIPVLGHMLQYNRWKMSRSFVAKGLTKLHGIAIDINDHVVVGCLEKGVKSYTNNGQVVHTVYDSHGVPDVATTADNRCIIAPVNQPYIQFTDMSGNKLVSFPITDINNKPSNVCSAAVDSKGRIVVGQTDNTISIHHADGSVISKFATESIPLRLAITSNDEIVSSFYDQTLQRGVFVALMDYSGGNVRWIQPPVEVKVWAPSFVCCGQGEIFIVNQRAGDPTCVYRFTADGDYLGCVITEVNRPTGIALSKDGMELYVAEFDNSTVKIFARC